MSDHEVVSLRDMVASGEFAKRVRIPRSGPVQGVVTPPPSKSVSHRYLNLGLLSGEAFEIDNLLDAEDTDHFVEALRRMGYEVLRSGSRVACSLRGSAPPASSGAEPVAIYCGNAGTFYRFAVASLCAVPGRFVVDGTPRLRERPIAPLVDALRALGARIKYQGKEGFAPLLVAGGSLRGGEATLYASLSSQYVSAVMMASTRAQVPTQLRIQGLRSRPYLDITSDAMRRFGVDVALEEGVEQCGELAVTVTPKRLNPPEDLRVEADWSAAAYPAAAAVCTKGEVELHSVAPGSSQGDRRLLDLFGAMGAQLDWADHSVRVTGPGRLSPLAQVDMNDIPDQVPTLAAVAALAHGTSQIVNVPHLRVKESDRLAAMAAELGRAGVALSEQDAGLTVEGATVGGPQAVTNSAAPVRISTYDDHRIAMSMAIFGLVHGGIVIEDPEVVCKSYPEFFHDLAGLVTVP